MTLNYILKSAILIAILSSVSCKEDDDFSNPIDITIENDCPEDIDLGIMSLLESSKNSLPYPESADKVIFSDSTGNEVVGQYRLFSDSINRYVNLICLEDTTQTYKVTYKTELKIAVIDLEEADISLKVRLVSHVNIGEDYGIEPQDTVFKIDFLSIQLRILSTDTIPGPSPPNSSLGVVLDSDTHPFYEQDFPTSDVYNFHGKDFYDVYHKDSETAVGKYKIFYNRENGVVGIENHDKSLSLKYEYLE